MQKAYTGFFGGFDCVGQGLHDSAAVDPNGTYLRTLDSILDRKLVTSANLKFVAPAKAGATGFLMMK